MTLAEKVKNTILNECPMTFSLYAGYGLKAGINIHFQTGVLLKEKRNDSGRVTIALYTYADGSKLQYRYNSNNGYKLNIV